MTKALAGGGPAGSARGPDAAAAEAWKCTRQVTNVARRYLLASANRRHRRTDRRRLPLCNNVADDGRSVKAQKHSPDVPALCGCHFNRMTPFGAPLVEISEPGRLLAGTAGCVNGKGSRGHCAMAFNETFVRTCHRAPCTSKHGHFARPRPAVSPQSAKATTHASMAYGAVSSPSGFVPSSRNAHGSEKFDKGAAWRARCMPTTLRSARAFGKE
jgi:hypothetical protein